MRIPTLLQKISDLADHPDRRTTIDIDLMLDYTRVLYADLLEWRGRLAAPARQAPATPLASPAAGTNHSPSPAVMQPAATAPTFPVSPQPKAAAPPVPPAPIPGIHEPTLAELAAAMDKARKEEEDEDEEPPVIVQPTAKVPNLQRPVSIPPVPDVQPPKPQAKPAAPLPQPARSESGQSSPAPRMPENRDIRSLISINEKYQIMSELFGNDKDAYEEALNHINKADNEGAALKWLQEQLWVTEERSESAQSFYDLVKRFKKPLNQAH